WAGHFPPGKVRRQPVNGADIVSTIHALADITPINNPAGRNFLDLLYRGEEEEGSYPMIQAYTGNLYGDAAITSAIQHARATGEWKRFIVHPASGTPAWLMDRNIKYKYIRYILPDYMEELYDLEADPDELQNLAVNGEMHHFLEALRNEA